MSTEQPISLIVGLGNSPARYQGTRHNAGADLVRALAAGQSAQLRPEKRFLGHLGRARICDREVWLLNPDTLMNKSGESVHRFISFYRLPVAAMLVAQDELDLAPGVARIRWGGGAGGHNGVRDLVRHCGGDFWRLRLGIGRPQDGRDQVGYVLGHPDAGQKSAMKNAAERALQVLPLAVCGQWQQAMHRLHSADDDAMKGRH